jgi:hypothetical protein
MRIPLLARFDTSWSAMVHHDLASFAAARSRVLELPHSF